MRVVLGDPQLMGRLVANLVDNAVRHNHRDGAGSWIRLRNGLDGGRPVLRTASSGRVIPPDRGPAVAGSASNVYGGATVPVPSCPR
ncbi:ATP-binding protein [Streptomyces mirabilis]|uniref:ATP-binding protein n=1 Tax=Streptomyces mirabilis TaxID=68239 RepID=UPI0036A447C8